MEAWIFPFSLIWFVIIMIIFKSSTSPILRLLNNQLRGFSVNNYMKTYQSHQVTRHHGYFKVDEYSHFDRDPS